MARFPPVILAQEILGAQCNDEAVHPPTNESWCSKWNTLSLYKYSRPAATHAVSDGNSWPYILWQNVDATIPDLHQRNRPAPISTVIFPLLPLCNRSNREKREIKISDHFSIVCF